MVKIFFFVNNLAMKKILFLLQEIIKIGLIFFISFLWLNYFLDSIFLTIFVAVAISVFFEISTLLFSQKSKNKLNLKSTEKEEAENMFFSLIKEENCIDFFLNLAKTRHKDCDKKKDYVIIHHNDKNALLYPFVKFDTLSLDDVILIINKTKKEKPEKIVILCNEYDKDLLKFVKNFDIEILILNKYETYGMLYKEYDYFPKITIKFKKEGKLAAKDLLTSAFDKSKSKSYIFSAIILLVLSFFVKMSIYYLIFTSILLLFAIFSLFNTKFNRKLSKEII